jgi:hypothetical protein
MTDVASHFGVMSNEKKPDLRWTLPFEPTVNSPRPRPVPAKPKAKKPNSRFVVNAADLTIRRPSQEP